ncbi:tyrosine-type recombinase/integrase [Methylobacterium sp. J-070]|uniref:tyrosine-type recombinase/integrase n=1 Tax=Methylobacterium sp. J-070 TaxID=2836650 RepID=UPI001FBAADDB|nr:site-specific integrase [Methylobacterium sp. J-070]MCJ2052937.1 site-specific integrase [Methylobacterium sp. J-070]
MPDAKRITKTAVEMILPGQTLWDAELKGFGVRCQRRDRVYGLKYRLHGQQRWFTIGKHGSPWSADQARREAKRLLGLVAAGEDPARKKVTDRVAPTVAELADLFLGEHVAAKNKGSTHREYERLVNRIVKPYLGRRRAEDVTHEDVRRLHVEYRATPYQANRTLALLSKMFAWSGRRGERNPCLGIERFGEKKRRRYLSAVELQRLGAALDNFERDGGVSLYPLAAIRLLLLTGARLSEILTLRWGWVDRERACLSLPDSKTGAKEIHLSEPALRILASLPRALDNPFVIVGQKIGAHLVNLEKPSRCVRAQAGLDDVRLHDLRHSFASIGAGAGLGLPMIGALLGHTQAATTARYAHLAADPLKAANELIGEHLNRLMSKA